MASRPAGVFFLGTAFGYAAQSLSKRKIQVFLPATIKRPALRLLRNPKELAKYIQILTDESY
jgi:hypothetical protein